MRSGFAIRWNGSCCAARQVAGSCFVNMTWIALPPQFRQSCAVRLTTCTPCGGVARGQSMLATPSRCGSLLRWVVLHTMFSSASIILFSFLKFLLHAQRNTLLLHNAIDASLNMVCNIGMTDTELIAYYGGPAKLARMLGFPEQGGVQRIQNWTTRGIPPAVKVQFPEIFLNVPKPPARGEEQEAA